MNKNILNPIYVINGHKNLLAELRDGPFKRPSALRYTQVHFVHSFMKPNLSLNIDNMLVVLEYFEVLSTSFTTISSILLETEKGFLKIVSG